jgi:hypothetical protein
VADVVGVTESSDCDAAKGNWAANTWAAATCAFTLATCSADPAATYQVDHLGRVLSVTTTSGGKCVPHAPTATFAHGGNGKAVLTLTHNAETCKQASLKKCSAAFTAANVRKTDAAACAAIASTCVYADGPYRPARVAKVMRTGFVFTYADLGIASSQPTAPLPFSHDVALLGSGVSGAAVVDARVGAFRRTAGKGKQLNAADVVWTFAGTLTQCQVKYIINLWNYFHFLIVISV